MCCIRGFIKLPTSSSGLSADHLESWFMSAKWKNVGAIFMLVLGYVLIRYFPASPFCGFSMLSMRGIFPGLHGFPINSVNLVSNDFPL